MKDRLLALGTVVDLELRQRVRSVAWYVLLGVSAALLLVVSLLLLAVRTAVGAEAGPQVFSVIVFFVLLLGSLVTPALSGGAINGDRDAGTLATTQVTLVTASQLLLGKFLAAWTASLAFLAVAVPFLLLAIVAGGVDPLVLLVALAVTVLELGVIAAIGVGLSAVIQRPIFSVVTTYLVVAGLSIGTLIAFGLGGLAFQSSVTNVSRGYPENSYDDDGELLPGATCGPEERSTFVQPRYDRVWILLSANPYVVLADAVPGQWSREGGPEDAFSGLKSVVRTLQLAPANPRISDECNPSRSTVEQRTPERIVAETVPSWFVGLGVQLLLAAVALVAGGAALRTPARRLAKGSRIA